MSDGVTATVNASVQVRGTRADRAALGAAYRRARGLSGRIPAIAAAAVFGLTITFGRAGLVRLGFRYVDAATFAAIIALVLFLLIYGALARVSRRTAPDPRGVFARGFTLTADQDGLHLSSDVSDAHYRWEAILNWQQTATHLFLYTDATQAIIVPKRCFADAETAARFVDIVRAHVGR